MHILQTSVSTFTDAKASGKHTLNVAHQFLMVHLVLVLHRVDFLASSLDAQSHLHADTKKEKVKACKWEWSIMSWCISNSWQQQINICSVCDTEWLHYFSVVHFSANLLSVGSLDLYCNLNRKIKFGKAKITSCSFWKKNISESILKF